MTDETKNNVLSILKADLGISTTKRDEYFETLIESNEQDLRYKGIVLAEETADMVLLSDYTAWNYRSRDTQEEMPKNLSLRILNRKMKARVEHENGV